MSLTRRCTAIVVLTWLAAPRVAGAQPVDEPPPPGSERFFADEVDDEDDGDGEDETSWQGSLVSTSLLHRETAPVAEPLPGGQVGTENASPVNRVFTDLRARLDAEHLQGADYDFHFDGRARVKTDGRFQSGRFAGNEYELREMYAVRRSDGADVRIGRQYVLELAATKIDGLSVEYEKDEEWTYLAFAGAYPARSSRSIDSDYPVLEDPMDPDAEGSRIIPISGGAGASYRFDRLYGSAGVVGILPRGEDPDAPGTQEQPRIFLTSNGYWRQSPKLDVYHFAVLDLEGAGGRGLTNLSLGANYRPRPNVRLFGSINRVDTETLNVIAQTTLEDPDPNNLDLVQNNVQVMRIASESARAGVSVGLQDRRYEVFTEGRVRQRPEIELTKLDDDTVTIEEARAAEVTLGVIGRRILEDYRVRASYTNTFGIGGTNADRSESDLVRVGGSRQLKDGKAEVEADVSYLASEDDNRDAMCMDLLTCFGTSSSRTISANGLLFYRFEPDWFLVASASLGRQTLTTGTGDDQTEQPAILLTTAFARLAYRF